MARDSRFGTRTRGIQEPACRRTGHVPTSLVLVRSRCFSCSAWSTSSRAVRSWPCSKRSLTPQIIYSGLVTCLLKFERSIMSTDGAASSGSSSSTTPSLTVTATPLNNRGVIQDALHEILAEIPIFRTLAAADGASGGPSHDPTSPPSSSGGSSHLKGVSRYSSSLASLPWCHNSSG